MAPPRIVKNTGAKQLVSKNKPGTPITKYLDFVISATRKSADNIEVDVFDSPVGKLNEPVTLTFPKKLEEQIHQSCVGTAQDSGGQMLIQRQEAVDLGRQLSGVLLPLPVFSLLANSLQYTSKSPGTGLRIRLSLDPDLMNLPWEYLYRPDVKDVGTISGFLMLDPSISMVREIANPRIRIVPIAGKQQLEFIGTFWQGGSDKWEVRTEFDKLRTSLKPVSGYLTCSFKKASDKDAFKSKQKTGAAIFHYSGHCDTDPEGETYLIREVPVDKFSKTQKIYTSEITKSFKNAKTRLVVLSACNSGYWEAVKPWLDGGIPAIVGVNGKVASISTNEFFPKLYESLAIGLSLDEAIGRARFHLMEWGLKTGFFDWGLYMVYMPSPEAILFPRKGKKTIRHQAKIKHDHTKIVATATKMIQDNDKKEYKEPIHESITHQVLILGRFTQRRKKILDALANILAMHPDKYKPLILDTKKPGTLTLSEWTLFSALASKFIIADLSEPKSVPAELEDIVKECPSRPIIPIINSSGRQYAVSDKWKLLNNVAQPTITYKNEKDLSKKVNEEVLPAVENIYRFIVAKTSG